MKVFKKMMLTMAALAASIGTTVISNSVSAQESDMLDEIIVRAERRDESIQTVPVSVAAYTGEAIARAGIVDISNIAARTPSFQVNFTNLGEPEFFIRGIGTDIESAGANHGVGFYIDEVYLARGAGSIADLFDVARVEVLRGPQGTHFGRSTSGGAVNYITNKPTHDTDAGFRVEVGDYDHRMMQGMVNGELSENIAGRFSFSTRTHAGYTRNVKTGNMMDSFDSNSVRGSLLFTPSENVDIQLTASTYGKSGGSIPSKLVYASRPSATPGEPNEPDPSAMQWIDGLSKREQYSDVDGFEDVESDSVTLRIEADTGIGLLTSITNYRTSFYKWNQNSTGNDYPSGITYSVYDFQYFPDFGGGGGDFFNNCFGPWFPAGLRRCWGSDNNTFADNYSYVYWRQTSSEEVDQWSQELRLASQNDGMFNWSIGAFYGVEEIRRDDEVDFAVRFGDGEVEEWFPGSGFVSAGRWHEGHELKGSNADVDAIGVFFTMDFDLSDSVRVSLGSRWSDENKDFWVDLAGRGLNSCACTTDENGDSTGAYDPETGTIIPGATWAGTPSDEWLANPGVSTVDNNLQIVPNSFGAEDSWDNVSSFISLRWIASDTTMLYGRIAEGFKGGGYEGISASGITFLPDTKFDEETSLTFEVGVKTDYMGGRARTNLSAFYNDYSDLQVQILVPEFNAAGFQTDTVALTTNAGDAEIYGAELEFTFLPFDGMTLSGSYGYLSTEIKDDIIVSVNTNPNVNDNYRGNELAKSPGNSFNAAADYEWSMQSGATASLRVDYSWTEEHWIAFNNYTAFPEQENIDASLTFTSADQQWQFRVFARNITDEDNLANIGATGDHSERFGNYRLYEDLAAPRTVGVSIAWSYQ